MIEVLVVGAVLALVYLEYALLYTLCYRKHWGPFWKLVRVNINRIKYRKRD